MEIFVNGTLMRGLPLHENLAGCPFVSEDRTESEYALYALGGGRYLGMIHVVHLAGAIAVPGEVYDVPEDRLSELLAKEPPQLYLGPVRLAGGRRMSGMLCKAEAARAALSISSDGGWRAYVAHRSARERDADVTPSG